MLTSHGIWQNLLRWSKTSWLIYNRMTPLIQLGKKRTILISISILLVSIHSIYFYHSVLPESETKKLIQQFVRLGLTILLLVAIYKT